MMNTRLCTWHQHDSALMLLRTRPLRPSSPLNIRLKAGGMSPRRHGTIISRAHSNKRNATSEILVRTSNGHIQRTIRTRVGRHAPRVRGVRGSGCPGHGSHAAVGPADDLYRVGADRERLRYAAGRADLPPEVHLPDLRVRGYIPVALQPAQGGDDVDRAGLLVVVQGEDDLV